MRLPAREPSGLSTIPTIGEALSAYLAACGSAGNGPPPDPEPFLAAFDEPERSALRVELEKLGRHRPEGESPTVTVQPGGSAAGVITRSERTAETRKGGPGKDAGQMPASPDGTGEFVALPDDTAEHSLAPHPHEPAADATIDHPATQEFQPSPDATLNHEPEYARTGEFVSEDAQTVDHAPSASGGNGLDSAGGETLDHDTAPVGTGEYSPNLEASTQDVENRKARKKPAAAVPKSVAGYEVLGVLGRGAMGVVYKARQRGLKRLVALKMILAGDHAGEQELARFRAEANAVAQLQHQGIIQIYEVGEDEGRPFFSLEFVDGISLHKLLQGNPLPPRHAAEMFKLMADAMAYAHARGVIHRDLKPANVLLTSDGQPKIGDFGLAKRLEDDESGITRTGTVMGTPSYMPPEQAAGQIELVGPLADVYSLGAMLYDMLTGRPPFRGTSVMDTIQQLQTREPVPPIQLQPSVPKDLETICLKCLEKDRNKRYAGAAELAADVQRYLIGEPILARPIGNIERAWRWSKRNKFKAGTYAAALLVAVGIFFGALAAYAMVSTKNSELDKKNKEVVAAKVLADKNADDAREAEKVAVRNEAEATKQKGIADKNANDAREAEKVAVRNEAEATKQKGIAEEKRKKAEELAEGQRRTAQDAIDAIRDVMQETRDLLQSKRLSIAAAPEAQRLRAEVLENLKNSLERIVRRITSKSVTVFAEAYVLQIMGDVLMKYGASQEPREYFGRARDLLSNMAALNPNHDLTRANLGLIEQKLGDLAMEVEGDAHTALSQYLKSRNIRENIRNNPRSPELERFPALEIKLMLAHDDLRLGQALLVLGRAAEARTCLEEALEYYSLWNEDEKKNKKRSGRPRSYMIQTLMFLGTAASQLGDPAGADKRFQEALGIGRELFQAYPDFLPYKPDTAEVEGAYGDALLRQGKLADAAKHYLAAMGYMKEWVANKPDDTSQLGLLALSNERLGTVCQLQGKAAEAKPFFKEAKGLREDLWKVERSNLKRKTGLVVSLARIGDFTNALPNCAAIRQQMTRSPELMLQVARCYAVSAREGGPDRARLIEQAVTAVADATRDDFQDAFVLETDPDLAVLRDQPAFKEIVAGIKSRK